MFGECAPSRCFLAIVARHLRRRPSGDHHQAVFAAAGGLPPVREVVTNLWAWSEPEMPVCRPRRFNMLLMLSRPSGLSLRRDNQRAVVLSASGCFARALM